MYYLGLWGPWRTTQPEAPEHNSLTWKHHLQQAWTQMTSDPRRYETRPRRKSNEVPNLQSQVTKKHQRRAVQNWISNSTFKYHAHCSHFLLWTGPWNEEEGKSSRNNYKEKRISEEQVACGASGVWTPRCRGEGHIDFPKDLQALR